MKWDTCCLPKDVGGLGIINLEMMNIALLAKWFWKMETEEGLWQDVIKIKYGGDKCLSSDTSILHHAFISILIALWDVITHYVTILMPILSYFTGFT